MRDLRQAVWKDHPANPLIAPPGREWLLADPTVVTPDQSPDGRFHLFANTLRGIHHYVSEDGIAWDKIGGALFGGLRAFVFVENGYHLFYERFVPPNKTVVAVRSSPDLETWSEPRTVLEPRFHWEGRVLYTNGNPCVVKHDGLYRLYYSASWVWLRDCYFIEPKYIGVAESALLLGPYEKRPDPIIGPSDEVAWRNLGAGAIRVVPPSKGVPWLAFNNGIYIDPEGRSRSEIHLLESDDGLSWRNVHDGPILAPEPGWKNALVYAMHVCTTKGKTRLYYNARDGWFRGTERIGLALAQTKNAKG